MPPVLSEIRVVADRTAQSRCDQGFLRLRRLVLRNLYVDGTESAEYPCDIVTRPSADAVAIVLYSIELQAAGDRRVSVVLKDGPRAPIYLRREQALVLPDDREYTSIIELVAGLIEVGDDGPGGLQRRAALESYEEAGYEVVPERVRSLGGGMFASPGISDEKVYFAAADVSGIAREEPAGDGSVMEETTTAVVLELRDAIRRCRDGRIPDMKTEVGLYRLADSIGYLPQIDRFVHELPTDVRDDFDPLGTPRAARGDS